MASRRRRTVGSLAAARVGVSAAAHESWPGGEQQAAAPPKHSLCEHSANVAPPCWVCCTRRHPAPLTLLCRQRVQVGQVSRLEHLEQVRLLVRRLHIFDDLLSDLDWLKERMSGVHGRRGGAGCAAGTRSMNASEGKRQARPAAHPCTHLAQQLWVAQVIDRAVRVRAR